MATALLSRQSVEAGGVSLDAVVLGDGSPTVVFVNGLGTLLDEWTLVAPAIAKRCRVVCYDRRPAPIDGPIPTHDAAQLSADLGRLLDALGFTGPLVLVGHSWGGALIRRYVLDHRDQVVGMVFVDATHENIRGMIPNRATQALYAATTLAFRVGPIRRRLLRALGFNQLPAAVFSYVDNRSWRALCRTARAEFAGIGPSLLELARVGPDLPPVPSRVLLAGGRSGLMYKLGAKQLAGIRAVWAKAVAGRSEITLQVVPDSGHYISLDQPNAVIDAIDHVIGQVSFGRAAEAREESRAN